MNLQLRLYADGSRKDIDAKVAKLIDQLKANEDFYLVFLIDGTIITENGGDHRLVRYPA